MIVEFNKKDKTARIKIESIYFIYFDILKFNNSICIKKDNTTPDLKIYVNITNNEIITDLTKIEFLKKTIKTDDFFKKLDEYKAIIFDDLVKEKIEKNDV